MNNTYQTYKKIRKVWGFNPTTRKKDNDKHYDRNKDKQLVRKLIKEGEGKKK